MTVILQILTDFYDIWQPVCWDNLQHNSYYFIFELLLHYLEKQVTCMMKTFAPINKSYTLQLQSLNNCIQFICTISPSIITLASVCLSITSFLFHSRLKTYLFYKSYSRSFTSSSGQPSQTFARAVSSELLGFCLLVFLIFFLSVPCARLSWPYRQLLSARKYRIVWYSIVCSKCLPFSFTHTWRLFRHS